VFEGGCLRRRTVLLPVAGSLGAARSPMHGARPAPLRLTRRWNELRLPVTGTAAAVTRIGLSLDSATLQSAQVVSWPWRKVLRGDALWLCLVSRRCVAPVLRALEPEMPTRSMACLCHTQHGRARARALPPPAAARCRRPCSASRRLTGVWLTEKLCSKVGASGHGWCCCLSPAASARRGAQCTPSTPQTDPPLERAAAASH
jgi:hypothetical protein